nr:hypothetical protein [Tanacetum cinerariifolium]
MEIGTQQPEEPKRTLEDEFQDLHLNLSILEVLAHAPMYNALLHKYVESLERGKNGSTFIQREMPERMEDPGLFTLPCRLGDSKPFDTLADLGSCMNIISLYLFKKLNIGLLKERPRSPFTSRKRILSNRHAVIDCKKAKIAVGEGITTSIFGVKGIELREEETPYWTTLGKRKSYKPRPSSDGVGDRTPYYAKKEFLDCHLPGEWEIARDVEINPFKDVLVFRRMVEFLGVILINLKRNMYTMYERDSCTCLKVTSLAVCAASYNSELMERFATWSSELAKLVVNVAGARKNIGTNVVQQYELDDADNSGPIFDSKTLQEVQNDDDHYNVFDNNGEHLVQPESVNDTYIEERGDNNLTIDSLDMSTNGETVDKDDDDLGRERDLLASLIKKLKCEIDDNKNRNKFLESSNKTLVDKLK